MLFAVVRILWAYRFCLAETVDWYSSATHLAAGLGGAAIVMIPKLLHERWQSRKALDDAKHTESMRIDARYDAMVDKLENRITTLEGKAEKGEEERAKCLKDHAEAVGELRALRLTVNQMLITGANCPVAGGKCPAIKKAAEILLVNPEEGPTNEISAR